MIQVLGLDIGPNSIGWAVVEHDFNNKDGQITDMGVRIIPMGQDMIGDFNEGTLKSSTSQRTHFRGVRRLRDRANNRRKRLIRVLQIMGFVPADFIVNHKHSVAYTRDPQGNQEFQFLSSYKEMCSILTSANPGLKVLPKDWTIYYLRKKALSRPILKEELAWVILQFNTKRGYHQLRGDTRLNSDLDQFFISDIITDIIDTGEYVNKNKILQIQTESGIIGELRMPYIPGWVGQEKELIMTQKKLKDDSLKITLKAPAKDDWTLRKKKTEHQISHLEQTPGAYIFDQLVKNPKQKIRGKVIHTIDRSYYRDELIKILNHQSQYHPELQDINILSKAVDDLYRHNQAHNQHRKKGTLAQFIIDDIIFYQRPLRTKKYLIEDCKYESYHFTVDGKQQSKKVKAASRSHPLFQEYRLWSIIHNLRIIQKEKKDESGHITLHVDVTEGILDNNAKAKLFDLLDIKKEISTKQILKHLHLSPREYELNYEENVKLKGNTTKSAILAALKKEDKNLLIDKLSDSDYAQELWHCMYSLNENEHLKSALSHPRFGLSNDVINALISAAPFEENYGSLSVKALKKMLPLMRTGDHWSSEHIHVKTIQKIHNIINGEEDDSIDDHLRKKLGIMSDMRDFQGLSEWMTSYVVYGRHSEKAKNLIYNEPDDIQLVGQHELRNPIVTQIINETLLVVRDIWKKYGRPDRIHIELARELKLPNKKRNVYTQRRNENQQRNARAKAMLRELKSQYTNQLINPYSKGHLEQIKLYEEGALNLTDDVPKDVIAIRRKDNPSNNEVRRYLLWLEQKYRSPYTGAIIPLSKLFTRAYDVEHVIPKSRYYDDSLNNKIICERDINSLKDNRTAYQFIIDEGGTTYNGHKILEQEEYEALVKSMFKGNREKIRNLLSLEIPDSFISRQLNDTRYISRKVFELLDPVVRQSGEMGPRSANLIAIPGKITSDLKHAWGLHDVWKRLLRPRFERMNDITGTNDYYQKVGNRIDLSGNDTDIKRLDHRHHALDALVLACTSRQHIMFLQSLNNEKLRLDLIGKIWRKDNVNGYSGRKYISPWPSFTKEAEEKLKEIIVSFKNKVRIINRTKNYYQKYVQDKNGKWVKKYIEQQRHPDFWAIRQPLHSDTLYGRISIHEAKKVQVEKTLKKLDKIADPRVRRAIEEIISSYEGNLSKARKHVKDHGLNIDGKVVKYITMRSDDYYAYRKPLNESFNKKNIQKIPNHQIRGILGKHLAEYNDDPKLAFEGEGLEKLNSKLDTPIYRVRKMEKSTSKYALNDTGQKSKMYVEAAKGTNLFYLIKFNRETGERHIDQDASLSLVDAVQLMKHDLPLIEDHDQYHYEIWHPNDLIYMADSDNESEDLVDPSKVYKAVSFNGAQCFCIPHHVATTIVNKKEYGPLNKLERALDGRMVKKHGIKIIVDRLGNIIKS